MNKKILLSLNVMLILTSCSNPFESLNSYGSVDENTEYDESADITESPSSESSSEISDSEGVTHHYVKHFGLFSSLSTSSLSTYYTCEDCDLYFDSKYRQISPVVNEENRYLKYVNKQGTCKVFGKDFEIFYDDDYDTMVTEAIITLKEDISNGIKSLEEITKERDELEDYELSLHKDYNKLYLASDIFNKNSYYTMCDNCYDLIGDVDNVLYDFETLIAASSYRNSYFDGKTDAEIDEYISGFDSETNTLRNELDSEMGRIQTEYNNSDDSDIADYFNKYKTVADKYAQTYGYDNYLDYAYALEYYREYDVDDVSCILDYIKDYVYPAYIKADELGNEAYQKIYSSKSKKQLYSNLYDNSFFAYYDILDSYANMQGGDYLKSFNHLFESGNYFVSNIENDSTTAYTWEFYGSDYFLFFGGDYQDVNTFIHEFGHYNADSVSNYISMDLAETQSQGNEALFSLYLLNSKAIDTNVAKVYLYDELCSLLSTAIACYLCNYVETKAYYSDESMTVKKLQSYWDEAANYIGYTDLVGNSYWEYALINSPAYYISYSLSALEAFLLYTVAAEDYDKGLAAYKKIYDYPSELDTFTDVCVNAGLKNIFEEDAYKDIYNSVC